MRILRILPLAGGLLALVLLIRHFGLASLTDALTRIAWWQFALICLIHGVCMVLDTLGWRYTLVADHPPFFRLLAARCAGQAVNVVTALGGVGGEAIKAWLLRRDIPYEASVPSLILAKTAEVVGQALLLVTGILVAWATGVVGWSLLGPMCYLLIVEVIAVAGFILAQVTGGVGRVGRLLAWMGAGRGARRVDGAVRGFYRSHWRSLLVSVGCHFASWLVGTLEVLLILRTLHVGASVTTAIVIEALGTGVRFATFFVPASLGTLEGANAAAFTALGWAASDGLAFSLVRRGRQAVWIGIGLAVLGAMGAMGAARATGKKSVGPEPARAD
jgi:glycosyltransferase 2 family protein